ncbi:efflux RND transporter periplasmic adaptor subunit [Cellulosilyticum ruminicola]|uniref:efflux RND transporter periplasmic adaptor subunit n=1 Tax=Cellulosilyticum ruminicola TaxID=425254 RepID=UPI0006CF4AB5|nr:efflux RND transporter periplasmic adaptor subunit [Cellulosilyticum ruminicola]
MKGKKILIIVAVVAITGVLVVAAVKNKPKEDDTIGGDKTGMRVQVEKVKTDNIETKISSSGKLEAIDTQTVYLDSNNKIIGVSKKVGDSVKKGDVIVVLDQETQLSTQKSLEVLQTKLAAANESLNDLMGASSKGDILKAQQSIATLQDSKKKAQNEIQNVKIEITNAKTDLSEAEKQLKLDEELLKEGLVSQNTVDTEKDKIATMKQKISQSNETIALNTESLKTIDLQITSAQYELDVLLNKEQSTTKKEAITAKKSEIKQLEKDIYDAQTSLNKATTQVVAPINGVITKLDVAEGMSVAAGTVLFTIVDPSKLKVKCNISPYYAADLKLGLDATVKYTGSKTIEVPGKVSKIAAVATTETNTKGETISLPIDVEITKPGDVLKPGFSVDVKIITDTREDVCVVPLLAVLEDDENEFYVYVVKEDGSLEKRTVTQGLSNGLNIEVEGVNKDELVVSNPSEAITVDTKVSYEKIADEKIGDEQ